MTLRLEVDDSLFAQLDAAARESQRSPEAYAAALLREALGAVRVEVDPDGWTVLEVPPGTPLIDRDAVRHAIASEGL